MREMSKLWIIIIYCTTSCFHARGITQENLYF